MASPSTVIESPQQGQRLETPLLLILIWQAVVGVACFVAASQIVQVQGFFDATPIVKYFIALIVALLGLASLASVPFMLRGSNLGRLMASMVDVIGFIIALLLLAHLLGLYLGFDILAAAIYRHVGWLLGIAAGYAVMWLGRRFPEDSRVGFYVERAGLGLLLLSLMAMLLQAGMLNAISAILGRLVQPASLAALAGAVVFIIAAVYLLRRGERFGETTAERETWQGWLFLLPNFVSFMIFFAIPLLMSLYFSFTNFGEVSLTRADWVGVSNYSRILSAQFITLPSPDASAADQLLPTYTEVTRIGLGGPTLVFASRDPLFWSSLWNTIRYCVLLLLLAIVPALGLAMMLNAKIPGMKFFRAAFFIPSIAAVVGVALIWQWLYNPIIGYINYALTGLSTLVGGGAVATNWLTDESVMLYAVVIMAAWQVIGFNTVILLAGLQNVSREVIEAATVDGANAWVRFRRIIMPLLAPTTFFVTVTTLISGLQAFSEFYTLLRNSTSNARLTTVFYLYLQGFRDIRFGYASATAWVLFVIIFAVTLIQFRISSRAEAYSD